MKRSLITSVLFWSIIAVTSLGCNNSEKTAQYSHDTTYIDADGNAHMFLAQIPDSLRTKEQNIYIRKLMPVIVEYTQVENNRFVFKLSKEDFLAKGLSKYDYNLTIKGINENNAFIKEKGLNADSLKAEMKIEAAKLN